MGPYLQYATEKAEDPLEIRIYRGANADFVLYEDENDSYNYEKGLYSTISLKWNDSTKQLIIGKRHGSYPGMIQKRTFNIVIVSKSKGRGTEITSDPDSSIIYNGEEKVVQL
jgi:alpha-D-xyloside xylohydrolase